MSEPTVETLYEQVRALVPESADGPPPELAPVAPGIRVLALRTPTLPPAALTPPLAQLAAHAELSRDRRALHERYLAELRARARARVDELPMLFAQSLGPAEIARLGDRIAGL